MLAVARSAHSGDERCDAAGVFEPVADQAATRPGVNLTPDPGHDTQGIAAPHAVVVGALAPLVDNAVRYSPPGPVEIQVTPTDTHVVISVRDRGIGIPADQQNRIFELFSRAHAGTPHDIGGLGIGLFMAREITLRHGGSMWFESEEGRGSTFYMRLPRPEVA